VRRKGFEMNIKKLQAEIESKCNEIAIKQEEIRIANEYVHKRKQIIAEHKCPFVIGQKVKSDYEGVCTVAEIRYSGWGVGYEISVHKTKKNGEPYVNQTRVWDAENFTEV